MLDFTVIQTHNMDLIKQEKKFVFRKTRIKTLYIQVYLNQFIGTTPDILFISMFVFFFMLKTQNDITAQFKGLHPIIRSDSNYRISQKMSCGPEVLFKANDQIIHSLKAENDSILKNLL